MTDSNRMDDRLKTTNALNAKDIIYVPKQALCQGLNH